MTGPKVGAPLDPYRDILGLEVTPERLKANLVAFADILAELRKLRSLDLTTVHPAVVFDPTSGMGDEETER